MIYLLCVELGCDAVLSNVLTEGTAACSVFIFLIDMYVVTMVVIMCFNVCGVFVAVDVVLFHSCKCCMREWSG